MGNLRSLYSVFAITAVVLMVAVQCGATAQMSPIILSEYNKVKTHIILNGRSFIIFNNFMLLHANYSKMLPALSFIVVPGLMGSQLDARIENAPEHLCQCNTYTCFIRSLCLFCNKHAKYKSLWLSKGTVGRQLLGINCLEHGLKWVIIPCRTINIQAVKHTLITQTSRA